VDPRTLSPLDEDTILSSVRKTHRLVIVTEEVKFAGSSAEIAAMVSEKAFDRLDAPIIRVAAPFVPIPFSPALEKEYIPSEEKVIKAIKVVMEG
jgi:pyruvate dehydrogenase E1 component beta subunit